jgi:hypothetical protein
MKELQIPQITEFIEVRRNQKKHVDRMSSERIKKRS